ncbi:rhomboid family intramembrane serine protease [Pontibacter sp. BT213]|uniref:Rhomboid family intramembrane serine protease n=2 Tax=Pontibacter fetidus TaxID=2700082 RepID=A0A6B2GVA8_9BACT|nr:rhomboid family intramembrane serine protease [Pontibacter fetidus]
MLQSFVPRQGYYITPILLNSNLFVFIVMLLLGISFIDPEAGQLFAVGGNYGPYTLSGQWWRLFTSTFIHAGIIHLALNMFALVSVGQQLEQLIGRIPFLIAYILCGLSGSLLSIWWDGTRVGVGASGAIFGMFGLLLTLMALEQKLTWQEKKAMLANLGFVIGINLLFGMKGGIDNAAHAGGLIAGIILGAVLMWRSGRRITQNYSLVGNYLTAGAGLIVVVLIYVLLPFKGQLRYLYTSDQFAQNEEQAMQVLYKLSEVGDEAKAAEFVPQLEAGIQLWDESETMLETIDDVQGKDKDRVLVLLDYVRLRKVSYQMLRDDLKHNRPLMNPKQQQVLYAIDGYARALQQGKEGDVVDTRFRNEYEMPDIKVPEDAPSETIATPNSNAAPLKALLVIDGVKKGYMTDDQEPEAITGLDEEQIESITVLKGKEAQALYGAEGANGVIQITTKK